MARIILFIVQSQIASSQNNMFQTSGENIEKGKNYNFSKIWDIWVITFETNFIYKTSLYFLNYYSTSMGT